VKRELLLPALALLAACGGPRRLPYLAPSPASGHLLIVGGGRQPEALVRRFVELAGGPGRARIAVFPMASEAAGESGREKAEELRGLGAEAVVLNLGREQALSDSLAATMEGFSGFWFPGGDQARLAPVLSGTPVLRAIQARWRAGAVVGGTSAGAAVMSDSMMTGNQYLPGVDTAGYYDDVYPRVARRVMEIRPGLGFLPGAIVDQHFLRRERANRLLSATLDHPALLGVGIDESTALEVEPDGSWRVLGASAVEIFDARDARTTPASAPVLGATGVRFFLLPAGSTFDPVSGVARLPGAR
jgi:cyanophycinase